MKHYYLQNRSNVIYLMIAATVTLFCNSLVATQLVPWVNHEGAGWLSGSWRQPDHLHLTHS